MKINRNKCSLSAVLAVSSFAHILLLVSSAIIATHILLRNNYPLMQAVSDTFVRPIHAFMCRLSSLAPFSFAELIIVLFVLGLTAYIVFNIAMLILRPGRLVRAYRLFIVLLSQVAMVYALYCMLWGVFYYGDSFMQRSGLEAGMVSVDELEIVTLYFADKLNEYSDTVPRDENGAYIADRAEILAHSSELFKEMEKKFPCLAGPQVRAKGVYFSRVLSYLDYTGFFFPLTAEANVNTDFPASMFAATVAHELSHQRGVAREQEANFVAVLTCMDFDDSDYLYSASMLAYTYLSNALYSEDYDAWLMIYRGLNKNVLTDIETDRSYWKQFETPIQELSNNFYEGFLQSYGQSLGLKSYGACVDLLVNYYLGEAMMRFSSTVDKS